MRHFTARPVGVDDEDSWRYGANMGRDFTLWSRRLYLAADTWQHRDDHGNEGQDIAHA
jgi:hypothetical protein